MPPKTYIAFSAKVPYNSRIMDKGSQCSKYTKAKGTWATMNGSMKYSTATRVAVCSPSFEPLDDETRNWADILKAEINECD